MNNETLLDVLLEKSRYLETIKLIAYSTGTKRDWATYNEKEPIIKKEIEELKAKVLKRMEVN